VYKAVEIGHIFKLGTKYSESMGALVLGADGSRRPIIMGSYGIGVERLLASVVERSHDEAGIIWPVALAPYQVVVTPVNVKNDAMTEAAAAIHAELGARGIDVLLDDRDERAGVKFNDADLIGIPYRITVGKKVADGIVELTDRAVRQSADVALAEVARQVADMIERTLSAGKPTATAA
jgi:prolyl-tRNA synthetase